AGASRYWKWTGYLGIATGVLILAFYSVIGGWVVSYILRTLEGSFNGANAGAVATVFDGMLASIPTLLLWHSVFAFLTVWVVARGVNHGLEQANKILMPSLFAILLVILAYSMV